MCEGEWCVGAAHGILDIYGDISGLYTELNPRQRVTLTKSVEDRGESIGVFRLCHPIHTISPTDEIPE